jgi:hypothetical protein
MNKIKRIGALSPGWRGGSSGTGTAIHPVYIHISGNEIIPEQTLRRYVAKVSGKSLAQMS